MYMNFGICAYCTASPSVQIQKQAGCVYPSACFFTHELVDQISNMFQCVDIRMSMYCYKSVCI